MERLTRLILEDPELYQTESQDAFIASLLQLQFDIQRDPEYYRESKAGRKINDAYIAFIRKHMNP